jgi:hypothetical protein
MMFFSSSLLAAFKLYVFILLIRCHMCLCCCRWPESRDNGVSCGRFPIYIERASCSFCIVTSRKLILLSVSFSTVNLMLRVRLLKELKTSCMFVMESLYTIKMSSTYQKYPIMRFCTRMLNILQ